MDMGYYSYNYYIRISDEVLFFLGGRYGPAANRHVVVGRASANCEAAACTYTEIGRRSIGSSRKFQRTNKGEKTSNRETGG